MDHAMSSRRWLASLAFVLCALPCGCSPSGTTTDAGATDGRDATDGGEREDAGPVVDAGGSNQDCTFNADCPATERCECLLDEGCFCRVGLRGTGQSGVDVCVDGNDCESSLCVEGNDDYYCSGPCVDDEDCGPALPVCADIAFLGRVCVR